MASSLWLQGLENLEVALHANVRYAANVERQICGVGEIIMKSSDNYAIASREITSSTSPTVNEVLTTPSSTGEEEELLHASIKIGAVAQVVIAIIAAIGLIYLLKIVMVTALVAVLLDLRARSTGRRIEPFARTPADRRVDRSFPPSCRKRVSYLCLI